MAVFLLIPELGEGVDALTRKRFRLKEERISLVFAVGNVGKFIVSLEEGQLRGRIGIAGVHGP